MQFGAVTFMLAERILRKLSAKVTHHSVARDLGDDACGSDAQANAIAIDDGCLRQWKRNNRQAVDQNVIRLIDQCFGCKAHGFMARTQNVDSINLYGINDADSPFDLWIRDQFAINPLA